MTSPTVTAVIPTRNRPQEVRAAVRSALAQTLRDLEVVVVLDGPDPATVDALGALSDPRLRWIEHPESRGANAARGSGIAAARASWVALLDDDDEWLPHKLDVQLARAARECEPPIVACGMELRLANGSYVVPRRPRAPDEPLSEYLFCRRGWKKREGVLQTSMLLAPTELFRAVPFRAEIAQNHETDWALRATEERGARLIYCDEVLGVWNDQRDRPRVTDKLEWRGALDWIQSVRHLVTPNAYSAYVLIWGMDAASGDRRLSTKLALLVDAHRNGSIRPKDFAVFLWLSLVSPGLRRRIGPHRRFEEPSPVRSR